MSYFRPGAGDYVGLGLVLSPETEHAMSYTLSFYGFSLAIHFPEDLVDMPSDVALVQPGYYVRALVTPSLVETDELVRFLPLKQRKCLFPDEYNSFFQNKYRHISCIARCRLYGILQRCGCIPFYYPHISTQANMPYLVLTAEM